MIDRIDDDQRQCERIPGDGVLEVVVRKLRARLPANREASGIGRSVRLQIDVGNRASLQPRRPRHRRQVDPEPEVLLRVVVRGEPVRLMARPQDAGDGDLARDLALGPGGGVLAIERHPAAIDEERRAAARDLEGRDDVVAGIAVHRARREHQFAVVQEAERVRTKRRKKEEIQYNHALFALLRQKRKAIADEASVPPYVIFSDRTLIEMCAYYPQSPESLLAISGVGQAKLEQYGDAFLNVIKSYCEKHKLQELPRAPLPTATPKRRRAGNDGDIGERTRLLAEAFNEGATIPLLMEQHQVTLGTILEHLTNYAMAGNLLRNGDDLQAFLSVTPEQQQSAFAAFAELDTLYLKPVHDKLNGTVNYDDLKILRLRYLTSRGNPVTE